MHALAKLVQNNEQQAFASSCMSYLVLITASKLKSDKPTQECLLMLFPTLQLLVQLMRTSVETRDGRESGSRIKSKGFKTRIELSRIGSERVTLVQLCQIRLYKLSHFARNKQ